MSRIMTIALTLCMTASFGMAAQLAVSDDIVTRDDTLRATLKLPKPIEAAGQLRLTWTDSYGRTVAVEHQPAQVKGTDVPVSLDLARAVALQNFLEVDLTVGDEVFTAPKTEFIVTPEYTMWDDYQIIMYNAYKPSLQDALRDVGITAGKISSGGTQQPDGGKTWYQHGYRFYCDQISTSFYAAYHTPAYSPKQKMLLEAKDRYRKDRSNKEPLCRKPCFHDPAAVAQAVDRLRSAVRNQKRFKPFFYAHCDEAGVADLVTAWDFCFDPRTLTAMRTWLMSEYGSLDAINAEWGTTFKTPAQIVPLTTDEMMARGDDNLSPWADHRFFMNKAFADVLKAGTDAVLAEDPHAHMGLVGCQMPSAFGGYDYWQLSQVMTCIEPYNIGNNRAIWGSFVPDKPAVTTAFGAGDKEIWRLWYQMLLGDVGIIIYDEQYRYLTDDGKATDLAKSVAPTYKELTGGIRKQLAYMDRVVDPIAIHYSQPSITAHWMFEARPEGKDWLNRGSAAERKSSEFLRLREACVKVIEDNLLQTDFVAYAQLENGQFDAGDHKVLILPQSIAMSKAECDAVRRFVERGGMVIADSRPALMDAHCKRLQTGQLDDLFGIKRADQAFTPGPAGLTPIPQQKAPWGALNPLPKVKTAEPGVKPTGDAIAYYQDANGTPAVIARRVGKGMTVYLNAVITDYHRWRLHSSEGEPLRALVGAILKSAGVTGQIAVTTSDGKHPQVVEVFPFRSGNLQILGLHRNRQLRVSELGPPEYQTQEALEGKMTLTVDLAGQYAVYNQRTGEFLGNQRKVTADLPVWRPLLLTLLPAPVEGLTINAPLTAKRGQLVTAKLTLKGKALGDTHALRVEVISPSGTPLHVLSQTLAAPGGVANWEIPIALSDVSGQYTLKVHDIATGVAGEHALHVQ